MIRITSDIDKRNKLLLSYYVMKAIILIRKIKFIEITPSHSKGWHLIIWSSYPYNDKQVYALRAKIGDDYLRIKGDKQRKIGRQTLFYKKIKPK